MPDDKIPWDQLTSGYKLRYDPRPALAAIEAGAGSWDDLFGELYHQGDVGTASYAAVPIIARIAEAAPVPVWQPFALAASIDEARREDRNPDVPAWLVDDYEAAWARLFATAWRILPGAEEENLLASVFAVIAIGKGQPLLARMALLSEKERGEMLEEVGWA
ncbi:MAG: hypothetical protein JOZ20_08385 [Sphingomonas sp.]|nr:hypothetical protein [Sphingomonas sp.]